MTRRFSLRRSGAWLLAGALLFVLAGDRAITAGALGIDPLEVLDLQVKPNVLVALDTSGSMERLANNNGTGYGGDHPRSKMHQAKQVLKAVFQANQDKASFMFGTYRYSSAADPARNMEVSNVGGSGTPSRFVYTTQSWAAGTFPNPACTVDPVSCPTPNPNTVTLPVEGPSPSMVTTELEVNSLYAYQWIQNGGGVVNNTLVFSENGGPTCTVTIPPDFYVDGDALAAAIETAMNGCAGKSNTYDVIYGRDTLSVTSITRLGSTATATTSVPHGFTTGMTVSMAGASQSAYNGNKTITVTGPNTFTYTVSGTPSSPAGGSNKTVSVGTTDRFSFRGTGTQFTLQWGNSASTIRGVLRATSNQSVSGLNYSAMSNDPRINLLQRSTGNVWGENYDPDGPSTTLVPTLDKPSPKRDTTTYNLNAHKFWNGETVYVDASGNACDIVPGTPTNPPSVTLQLTTNCASGAASGDATNRATFTWGGGDTVNVSPFNAGNCLGLDSKVPLIPCDQTTPPQYVGIAPFLENQVPLAPSGSILGYSETLDGTGRVTAPPDPGGAVASGGTPLAQTANDVRALFGGNGSSTGLWHGGQTNPALDAIKLHLDPKEKTIFILVTDGDACCGDGGCETNAAALIAAAATQRLYNPDALGANPPGNGADAGDVNADGTIDGDPAASVMTYVVAYGTGVIADRANWIAWGGSGMQRPLVTVGSSPSWDAIPSQADRDACTTCIDAFQAPDADTLKLVLERVINQGASTGEFSAQQSLTDSIYELAGDAPQGSAPAPWSPFNPRNRYDPLVPHRFVSTFSLPLFTGQIRAYTQDGPDSLASTGASCLAGAACRRWSANDKLVSRVASGLAATCSTTNGVAGVLPSQCRFDELTKGATASTDFTAGNFGIERRIFTTSQNGVFGPTVDQLIAGQSPFRVALWPPQTGLSKDVAPASDTSEGLFDAQLGLPLDSAANPSSEFDTLRDTFRACKGTSLPASCPPTTQTSGFTLAHMQRARREAREMMLAFLAGARFLTDSLGDPKRVLATTGLYTKGDILYVARTEILAESTVATPAVVGPPQEELPEGTAWKPEYELYRDGPRDHGDPTTEPDGKALFDANVIRAGFGLRNPDRDGTNVSIGTVQGRVFYQNDSRPIKPVMSVLYAGSNLALHAFRAGTSVATSITTACTPSATTDCGGEELWAFLPYDQLGKLRQRYVNNPQKRDPHDYAIARAVRYSDVFVPTPGTDEDPDDTPVDKTVSGTNLGEIKGVWRKVLFVGRGKGGKYLTAIDVTAPGMFTDLALSNKIVGPIVLWSRGNPDTTDGRPAGTKSHDQADYDAYLKMGETWSVPAVAYIGRDMMRADDPSKKVTASARKPKGNDFLLYVGSGYGNPGEGTTFYSLDPLTGDVITSVDVDAVVSSTYSELKRSGMAYANAIVANPVVFNAARFLYAAGGVKSPNVAAAPARRVYVGDLHGRLWKFLTAAPDKPLPVADLGVDQPVATAASLLGLPANDPNAKAHVYVTSGNDNRASQNPRFANFGFLDNGSDVSLTVLAPTTQNGIQVYPPMESKFVIPFEDLFRGTVQPATAYSETDPGAGRVFFGGTRFNPPASPYAPPVPPYPCRSSFDSILYALGAQSGLAAYDLAFGNAYQIFQDSRIVALSTQAAPGASVLAKDEGLSKPGSPITPPPPMGLSPSTQATQNVVPVAGPGMPQPTVRFGSTVCQ
jgi:hypothetical protein